MKSEVIHYVRVWEIPALLTMKNQ